MVFVGLLVQLVSLKNRCSRKMSERNLVDCFRAQGNEAAGWPNGYAFEYVKDNQGLDTEESSPYLPYVKGACYSVIVPALL